MEQEKIRDGNEAIAKFMGGKPETREVYAGLNEPCIYLENIPQTIYTKDWVPIRLLKYHESFDWLMPVVEKIQAMGYKIDMLHMATLIYNNPITFYNWHEDRLTRTWIVIVEFINWQNKQKDEL